MAYMVYVLLTVCFCYVIIYHICGYSSVVERNLAKVDVARSNRVTRLTSVFYTLSGNILYYNY